MLRTVALTGSALVLVAGVTVAAVQFSSGPPASRTGAPPTGGLPAESECSTCHVRFNDVGDPINNVNLPGGAVEILDLPATYAPGQTYPVRVRLWSDSTITAPDRKWGFEITAIRISDGRGAGTFLISTPELQIKNANPAGVFASRSYVLHTTDGTRDGVAGPVTWDFEWQAPAASEGDVLFCAAGNAADGTLDPGNDNIYASTTLVRAGVTPTASTTWGTLKKRFR